MMDRPRALPRTANAIVSVIGIITFTGTAGLTARRGETVQGATSTGGDGSYRLSLPPETYRVAIEMAGFERVEREVTLSGSPCEQVIDVALTLRPRASVPVPAARGRGAGAGRGQVAGSGGEGFQTLAVNRDEAGTQAIVAAAGHAAVAGDPHAGESESARRQSAQPHWRRAAV